MTIIDSQVHAYEANTPKRPWHTVPNWPDHVTGDEMVTAMDKVGVDGAIFISAFSLYRYDAGYAVEVQRAHPGRFAIVNPVDPDDPAVADVVADWKHTPGAVGIRIILTKEANREPNDPGLDPDPARGRSPRFSGEYPVLGQLGRGDCAHRSPSRDPIHRRPSRHHAAARAARTAAALGRSPEGAGIGQAPERGDQGQRCLHAVPGTISLRGYLGPACPRVRCLGFRSLLVGHGLDSRVRSRQLRAGRRALP